jgi:hypothetical protein
MSTQIGTEARTKAYAEACVKNGDGTVTLKPNENFETIFNRAVAMVDGLDPKDISDSQKTSFRTGIHNMRGEVFARTSTVKNDENVEVNAYDFLKEKGSKTGTDMMKLLTTGKYKDKVTKAGKTLPVPPGFEGGSKGRKAVNPIEYLNDLL